MTLSTYTNIFGDENFADTWILVTDKNNCEIYVTIEDLIEEKPTDLDNHVKVDYYGKIWWISKNIHFPM